MRFVLPAGLLLIFLGCSGGGTPEAGSEATTAAAPPAASDATSPAAAEAIVQELYASYLSTNQATSLMESKHLSEALGAAWVGAMAAGAVRGNEAGPVDFDPLVAGQDFKVSNLKVTSAADGAEVVVTAQFDNFTTPTEVKFRMIQQGGAWKIDNVTHNDADDTMDWDLRALLASYTKG